MRTYRLLTAAILGGVIPGVATATFAFQRGGGQHDGGQNRGNAQQPHQTRPAPQREAPQPRQARPASQGGAQQPRQPATPPVHAQREVVRTPNFVPRVTVPRPTGGTAPRQSPPERQSPRRERQSGNLRRSERHNRAREPIAQETK